MYIAYAPLGSISNPCDRTKNKAIKTYLFYYVRTIAWSVLVITHTLSRIRRRCAERHVILRPPTMIHPIKIAELYVRVREFRYHGIIVISSSSQYVRVEISRDEIS